MKKYIVTTVKDIKTGFLFDGNKLQEIRTYEEQSSIGNIYVGRVSSVVKHINAAFVNITPSEVCYLSMEDYNGTKRLAEGDLLLVQIVKDRVKSKPPSVTTNISLTGEYVVVHEKEEVGVSNKIKDKAERGRLKDIFRESLDEFSQKQKCSGITYGGIVRTRGENADAVLIKNEITELLQKLDKIILLSRYRTVYSVLLQNQYPYAEHIAHLLKNEVEVITDCTDVYDSFKNEKGISFYMDDEVPLSVRWSLKKNLKSAMSKKVYLKSGAYIVLEPTEAMVVIDVNSGNSGKLKGDVFFKINCEAAVEIARQLKLRNYTGIIVIDFISMKSYENNINLLNELKKLVENDDVPTKVVEMTKLGLVELTRKKIRKPLHEVFGPKFFGKELLDTE